MEYVHALFSYVPLLVSDPKKHQYSELHPYRLRMD